MAAEAAASLESIVTQTFKARLRNRLGPEPGVLAFRENSRLYVNAPDRYSPWNTKPSPGTPARRPGARGARRSQRALLARVVHHGTAGEISRINPASDVANRFWFDTLFKRWASDCIAEFEAGRNRP